MILQTHSDALHLSVPKARSRVVGLFFLSNNAVQPNQAKLNGTIHVLCKIIKILLGSAAESKIAASFLNTHEAIPMRNTLEEIDHKQPATPIQVDNTTAVGFIHKQIKQRHSKAIGMIFYWLQDR